MNRLLTLAVGTREAEEHYTLHRDLALMAVELGSSHNYVSVTVSEVDGQDEEDLIHDETTLDKVREAIHKGAQYLEPEEINNIVNEMQNAGILFRERS